MKSKSIEPEIKCSNCGSDNLYIREALYIREGALHPYKDYECLDCGYREIINNGSDNTD